MNASANALAASSARQGAGIPRALTGLFLAALLPLAALGGGCVSHRAKLPPAPVPAPESLVDDAARPLSPAAFARDVAGADYILLGEEHPNPCDHLAQAAVIRRLAAVGVFPAIGLEMVPADLQPVLDRFGDGRLSLAELPHALDWKATWGFDFELYAPIFEAAREYRLPLFALNAPKGLARKVGKLGLDALSPAERASLPGAVLPPAPEQVEELRGLFAQHAAMRKPASAAAGAPAATTAAATATKAAPAQDAPPSRDPFADFLTVQSLWDTQMAARALTAHALTGRPVVVIAGAGHVAGGWGIARRLGVYDPAATVAAVIPWRGGEPPDPDDAHLFYVCPAIQKSRLGMTLSHDRPAPGQPATPLLVTAVVPDSPAAKAGLMSGDAVVAAGTHPATELAVLHQAAMEALKAGEPLTLTVSRAGETLAVAIPLAAPPAGK
ncbi:MAG: ChaN family lipoprotein [Acidobacteriota bacterium]